MIRNSLLLTGLLLATPAFAAEKKLAIFVAAGELSGPGTNGLAATGGVRLALGSHFAASADIGYGLLSGSAAFQDRCWLIPAAAVVMHAGPATIDVGAGFGLGIASGYPSSAAYFAKPFMPAWAFQLVPTARGHAVAAMPLTPGTDIFVRLDVASVLVPAGPHAAAADTMWTTLSLGVQFRVL